MGLFWVAPPKVSADRLHRVQNGISECIKKGTKQIDKVAQLYFYRPDLTELAKKKYLKIRKSFQKPKTKKTAKAEK